MGTCSVAQKFTMTTTKDANYIYSIAILESNVTNYNLQGMLSSHKSSTNNRAMTPNDFE